MRYPDYVKRFRPKGTIVKRVDDTFYAYYTTSKRVPNKKYPVQIIKGLMDKTVKVMQKIRAAHQNIEMQHWSLDIQLKEDQQTARKDDAIANGSKLKRFCMALKKQDAELSAMPMKRFLIANEHNSNRIEQLLSKNVPQEKARL